MPIDGHAHLVAQGWSGKGSGLRPGAISRPIVVAQKKTLSGIGKDRDEAFPFWDHVFNAAANSIKVKVYDSDSEDTESFTPTLSLQKTKTGIISNRRPTAGTPALSGTATPSGEASSSSSGTSTPRLSVMAMAKQQAAKRMLYSMFFRGPVLGNALEDAIEAETTVIAGLSLQEDHQPGPSLSQPVSASEKETKIKKRKRDGELDAQESGRKRSRKGKEKADGRDGGSVDDGELLKDVEDAEKAERKRRKAEKRARKEEKRRLKAEKELKALAVDLAEDVPTSTASHDPEQNLPGAPTKKEKRRSKDPETKRKKDRAKDRSKSSSSS